MSKGSSRNNERKNAARPTGFNDALLSAVVEKPSYPFFSFSAFFFFFISLEGYISVTRFHAHSRAKADRYIISVCYERGGTTTLRNDN